MKKLMKDITASAPTLKEGLRDFKRCVREITMTNLGSDHHKYFMAARSPINRVREIGILNKLPAIMAEPEMSELERRTIVNAILKQKGQYCGKKKWHTIKALCDLRFVSFR